MSGSEVSILKIFANCSICFILQNLLQKVLAPETILSWVFSKNRRLEMNKSLKVRRTSDLTDQEKVEVSNLWNSQYPEQLSYHTLAAFDEYLQNLNNLTHFLLTNELDVIFGWALTFERENEKWFAIILSDEIKGKGFGRKLLDQLKETEPVLNGWVIDHYNNRRTNGEPYISPLKFYEKCDFEILTDARLELAKISAVKIKWTNLR